KTLPPVNGAWLVQNSWGTNAGDQGYYWVSYGDKSFPGRGGAMGYLMETPDLYDGIYLHDPLGECDIWLLGDVERVDMANVYTAERNERIVSVGFYTCNTNLDYEIQVYKNVAANGDPASGVPVFASPQRGTAGPIGYRAVRLDKPVSVAAGERFAVAVKLIETPETLPSGELRVSIEKMYPNYSDNAEAHPGESFTRVHDGEWADTCADTPLNLCVKAFTVAENSDSGGCSGAYGASLLAATVVVFLRRRR
ncbi:lectin like domain-containing protein, partial [Synergistaceae bacterium OttesenSCG-928-I11]|nr:lectin like domain-containing protein [Synergistaceae bacterium OttesenSCG-928-I11]